MSNKIGIVLLATNAYFALGVRFIKKFVRHYKGESKIKFYFFSDNDPKPYLQDSINVEYYHTEHKSWVDATNSKFSSILSLTECDDDYLYYFDADTNVSRDFTEHWFIGELVGGEHHGNRGFLSNGAGFDRFEKSKAYVPLDSPLPYTYYYGAFFGGVRDKVIEFCKILREWQLEDKKIPYEPGVNDESYLNAYFHYNPPTMTVTCEKFAFVISDKGGIEETRNTKLDINDLLVQMLFHKNNTYDIIKNKLVVIK